LGAELGWTADRVDEEAARYAEFVSRENDRAAIDSDEVGERDQ
jgi:hypothetical protein